MSAPAASTGNDSRDTLLLYCPYDRKVTGHARRGSEGTLVCLECGRRLEVSHVQRTAPILPIAPAPGTYSGPRSMRARRAAIWRRRSQTPWVPLTLVGMVAVAALFAVATSLGWGNPFAAIKGETPLTTSAPQSSAAQAPAATQPAAAAATAPTNPPASVKVANTGGVGAYVRRTPNMNDRLRAWMDGTELKLIGPDTNAGGVDWKHVQDPAGNQGWIPSQYTIPGS